MSQNPTLSAAAKTLSKATGVKHTACLRALEQANLHATDPDTRLGMAVRILSDGHGDVVDFPGARSATEGPIFSIGSWWESGRHLGIYGAAMTGKTVLAQAIAAEALSRGVRSWMISPHHWDHSAWAGLVEPSSTSPSDPWARTIVEEAASTEGDRVLFVEELGHLAGETGDPVADERLRELAQQLRRLIENTPAGLRIVAVSQQPIRARSEALVALLETGDAIHLGPAHSQVLTAVGVRAGTHIPSDRGHGAWVSPAGQGPVEPVKPHSPFAAGRDWNRLYRPEGYRAIEERHSAPVQIEVGDRLRYWCEKRLVWTARAVAGEGDIVVATTSIFGKPSYLATSFNRGIRGPHGSWGHAAVTDEDCVRTAAALASGEIDFSARNSVRLDLRSVERDGEIIWSDEG